MRQQLLRQLRAFSTGPPEPREPVRLESAGLRALFSGGLRRGTLTEWFSEGMGAGTESLALKLVAELRGGIVVVDSERSFYPPAAAALGISLSDTILVRPQREGDALWAVEQSLRCRGVGGVVARLDRVESRSFRRLQLAAEHGGTIGVFLRPASQRAAPSWAQARFTVRALPSQPGGRRLQIESLHLDGGDAMELEINDETGALCLVSRLADSTALRRTARA